MAYLVYIRSVGGGGRPLEQEKALNTHTDEPQFVIRRFVLRRAGLNLDYLCAYWREGSHVRL